MYHSSPLFDITKSFDDNLLHGPYFTGKIPVRRWPHKNKWHTLFGYPIASPIGISACPMAANIRGITLTSRLGFDVITHKTIRRIPHPANSFPNVAHVNIQSQLTYNDINTTVVTSHAPPRSTDHLAITNSIGNASTNPSFITQTIDSAKNILADGQVLIVSVYGTQTKDVTIANDFALTANLAREAGAHIIEANLACPNVNTKNGTLYTDPNMVYCIVSHIKKQCNKIPLIIKVGIFASPKLLKDTLMAAARAGAQGICGINSVPMRVVNKQGEPFFGNQRKVSGISGAPIRNLALSFIQEARTIIDQEKLNLTILATGGITKAEHFDLFFNAGADIALSATAAMWNPYLANEYHQQQNTKEYYETNTQQKGELHPEHHSYCD